ncbi:MAG: SCO1664 family protein [Dermatophilaceae bacterium]
MDGPRTAAERGLALERLERGEIEVVGRIVDASNVALLVEVGPVGGSGTDAPAVGGDEPMRAIYKPVRGERPLWDFPEGTLAGREVASWLVGEVTAYGIVPPTVLREGPMGAGSVQLWIGDPFADQDPACAVVRLVPAGQRLAGWLTVLDGEVVGRRTVSLVHQDADDVRDAAVLDAVLNNSDRKGSHLVRDGAGTLWGFDHGLTLHADPKLRTVLWGWAGQPLRSSDLDRLRRLAEQLDRSTLRTALDQLLPQDDVTALRGRVRRLVSAGVHPRPSRGWPSIPWPAL